MPAQSVLAVWQDPAVTHCNRFEPRSLLIPFADDATARSGDRSSAPSYRCLNGVWRFHNAERVSEVPADAHEAEIDESVWDDLPVPSVW